MAIEKTLKPDNIKGALFLHIVGEKAIEVYNALIFTDTEKAYFSALISKFSKFIETKKDLVYEQYIFNKRNQKEGKIFLFFLMDIISKAEKCGFKQLKQNMIGDQIISGVWSERIKSKLRELADPDLNTVIRL